MVVIFNEAESTTIPWEEINTQTPEEIIARITGKGPEANTYLTKCGVRFPADSVVSDAGNYNKMLAVNDNDFLRIVYAEEPSTSAERPDQARREQIEKQRRELGVRYRDVGTKERNKVLYMGMLNYIAEIDFFDKMLDKFPDLRKHPEAMSYVADPMSFFAVLKEFDANRDFCCEHPVILDVIRHVLWDVNTPANLGRAQAQANGPMNLYGANRPQRAQQAQGAPAGAAITADMLQQAINFAMGAAAPAAAAPAAAPVNPPAAVAAPDPLAQYREQYAPQMEQLREFGFHDDELNLSVLVQCEGNVATAMEILIDDANPHQ